MIPRDRKLDDLAPAFKPLAIDLLARLTEAGILVMIVETLRTDEQHAEDVASGHSWIARSRHQDGLAIDICPYSVWQLHGEDKLQWSAEDPIWEKIGAIGESRGLKWGGRFKPPAKPDLGHFEMRR